MTSAERETFINRIMADRESAGLKLTFRIPGRQSLYSCFALDDGQKQAWLSKGQKAGWELIA
jgi:hypothetical protein